jgi:hypothetical protein
MGVLVVRMLAKWRSGVVLWYELRIGMCGCWSGDFEDVGEGSSG